MRLSCIALLLVGFAAAPAENQTTPGSDSIGTAAKLVASGQLDAALQQLNLLADTHPEPAEVENLRGIVLYQQGKMADAADAFAKAVLQDPHNLEAMQMQGASLFREGKPAAAIPLLEKAHTAVASANIDPNYVLGLCYMDTRRYDDARHAFAQQYGFAADSAEAYLLAARMFLRRDYLPVAEESARKAIAIDPNLRLAHLLLGEVALATSRFPEALGEFSKERDLNPLYGAVYERLGDTYIHMGDYDQAFPALNKAVLLEPTTTGPYILLGKVLIKQKNPLMARMYLERARTMDPGNYMAHSLLGQAYRALGRDEDSVREFQIAEQIQAAATPKLESTK